MGKKITARGRIGFSSMLRLTRFMCCFTQEEIARFAGIPYNTYITYESGRSIPSVETLRKIAIAFDVPADWLLELTNTMQPDDHRIQYVGSDEWDIVQTRLQEVAHRSSDKEWQDKLCKETGVGDMARAYKEYIKAYEQHVKMKKSEDS